MQLTSRHELAFVTATLTYRGTTIEIPDVLVDTGAASTVLNADLAADTEYTSHRTICCVGSAVLAVTSTSSYARFHPLATAPVLNVAALGITTAAAHDRLFGSCVASRDAG